eukprot:5666026-Prymnesium_polylepis.1
MLSELRRLSSGSRTGRSFHLLVCVSARAPLRSVLRPPVQYVTSPSVYASRTLIDARWDQNG